MSAHDEMKCQCEACQGVRQDLFRPKMGGTMEDCSGCHFFDGCPALGEGWIGCQGYKPGVGIVEQPAPIPNNNPHIVDLVMQDMAARKDAGLKKYRTPLQAHNGRDPLTDLYQELIDAVFYARQAIEERDA